MRELLLLKAQLKWSRFKKVFDGESKQGLALFKGPDFFIVTLRQQHSLCFSPVRHASFRVKWVLLHLPRILVGSEGTLGYIKNKLIWKKWKKTNKQKYKEVTP